MGSGRSDKELGTRAKKPRERRRREKTQKRRLLALGMTEAVVNRMTVKDIRRMLTRPAKVKPTTKTISA